MWLEEGRKGEVGKLLYLLQIFADHSIIGSLCTCSMGGQ